MKSALTPLIERLATERYRICPAASTPHAAGSEPDPVAIHARAAWPLVMRRLIELLQPDTPAIGESFDQESSEERSVREALSLLTNDWDERVDLGSVYEDLLGSTPSARGSAQPISIRAGAVSDRKASGSFYTPTALVQNLLDSALEPVIRERLDAVPEIASSTIGRRSREDAVLSIRVCDPACGSGRFLVGAGERLADHLARVRMGTKEPTQEQTQAARNDVFSTCLFGVDLDPIAVEICRFNLRSTRAASAPAQSSRADQIKTGNALLWARPELVDSAADASTRARDRWCAERVSSPPVHCATGSPLDGAGLSFFHWDLEYPSVFEDCPEGRTGFDVVIGNPPFLNQLESATVTDRALAPLLRELFDGAISGYSDLSAAFLLLARRLTVPGGRLALVMPQSLLAARDAAGARNGVLQGSRLESLWISNERVFPDASVLTCAPTIHVTRERRGPVRRSASGAFIELDPIEVNADELATSQTWSYLGAAAMGIPEIRIATGRTLAEVCDATADFRDQYYGLDGFIVEDNALTADQRSEDGAFPPIVTSGLIDLAECRWGRSSTRLLKSRWLAPRIDRTRMDREGDLGPWLDARSVPKLILATQTRVLEVFADPKGRFVPSVPLISIVPKSSADLWRVGAALASPVLTAHALRHYAGAALHADAIKLSAKQVLGLPLPADSDAWDQASERFREASAEACPSAKADSLIEYGRGACRAYQVSPERTDELMAWWAKRLTRNKTKSRPA